MPNPDLLVRPYVVREAVASTRIEGTRASIAEVYDAEASDLELSPDLEEVVNYVRATEHAADAVGRARRLADLGLLTERRPGPRGQRRWEASAVVEAITSPEATSWARCEPPPRGPIHVCVVPGPDLKVEESRPILSSWNPRRP